MSEAMKLLQARCGCKPDGSFGPNTAKAIARHYDLSTNRAAHLLGQASHESGGFRLTVENLNYSVESIMRVWPSKFESEADAKPYARNPKALAEFAYLDENRGKNHQLGNDTKEKASLYIGRGFIQLTGYNNVKSFASDMRLPNVLSDPTLLEEDYAMETAIWFFNKNKLWKIADKGVGEDQVKQITKRVNGGYHGLSDRIEQTNKIYGWLS